MASELQARRASNLGRPAGGPVLSNTPILGDPAASEPKAKSFGKVRKDTFLHSDLFALHTNGMFQEHS